MGKKCSIVTTREKSLYDEYKSRYSDEKDLNLQLFNNDISVLMSNPNNNFNYFELLSEGKKDVILGAIRNKRLQSKEEAKKESLIFPDYTVIDTKATSVEDVVKVFEDKNSGILQFQVSEGMLSMSEVQDIIKKFIESNSFNKSLASNLRNNINSLIELEAFAMYLAENKYYNSHENDDSKFKYEDLVANALMKLNSYAKINSKIADIRSNYRQVLNSIQSSSKPIVQSTNSDKNGYFGYNNPELASNSSEAYRMRTKNNIDNSDVTLLISPWDRNSAGTKLTRNYANEKGKLVYDFFKFNKSLNIDAIVNSIIEKLSTQKGIDLNRGIILNIAGNGLKEIIENKGNQEGANKLVYAILKGLQDKGVKIAQVISGGQTGIDEAGIIAAAALKIPYRIHAAAFTSNKNGKSTVLFPLQQKNLGGKFSKVYGMSYLDEYLSRFSKEAVNRLTESSSSQNQNTNSPISNQNQVASNNSLDTLVNAINRLTEAIQGKQSQVTVKEQTSTEAPQDILQQQQDQLYEDAKREESRIKQSVMEVKASPVALLHRAIGKNAPQIILHRMKMFSTRFSNIVDSIVDDYIDEQYKKSNNTDLPLEERERAYYNYTRASNSDSGRKFVISETGNIVIERMKSEFKDEMNLLENDFNDGLIDEDIYSYRKQQWQIVQDHFNTIFNLTSSILERNENIKIKVLTSESNDPILTINDNSNTVEAEEENTDIEGESNIATGNDGWVFKTRDTDPHIRMSQAVKSILRNIPKSRLSDDGVITEEDDLGQQVFWEEDQLYAILVKEFSKAKEPADFCIKTENSDGTLSYDFPLLNNLVNKYYWINDVIDLLENSLEPDPITNTVSTQKVSLFYSNFRNDFISYYANIGGKSISLNTESSAQSTLDDAISNFEHGNIIGNHSIYDTSSRINKDNIAYWIERENKKVPNRLIKLLNFITNYSNLDSSADYEEIRDGKNSIVDLFRSIGLNFEVEDINSFISTELGRKLLKNAIGEANKILVDLTEHPESTNITDTYKSNYKNIGKHLDKVYEMYVQQSHREGDKTRYSYSTPNYIDTLIKFLNQSDIEARHKYMTDTYGKYEWFYNKKTGKWRNDTLQRLWDGEQIAFSDSKDLPIINLTDTEKDKHEYSDWTPVDISATFFSEFYAYNDSKDAVLRSSAYYNFPIFSDSPICKLVKMPRYNGTNSAFGSNYLSEVLSKLVEVGEQELWRISLVRKRKANNAEPIVNFDDKGEKFCFFPSLNKITANDLLEIINNNSLVTTFEDEALKKYLLNIAKTSYSRASEVDFNDAENTADHMKIIHYDLLLQAIKDLTQETGKENPTLMDLIEQANSKDHESEILKYDIIKKELLKLAINNEISIALEEFIESNTKGLATAIVNLVNNNKLEDKLDLITNPDIHSYDEIVNSYFEEIENYFYNSYLATANIIELTTTDLAFYKNATDFQKRYKQVYASGTKLNTQSKYGKEVETTAYLRDNVITVPTYQELKQSLQEAVNNKDLHKSEMDTILDLYMEITQTDAQAFRSVKSVRDVLDMLGQLNPAMEDMFNRMLDKENPYEYKYSDFNNLIQTIKPFFFGHDTINSGVNDDNILMVPHQNKNSEFALLASLGLVAGVMKNSPQLRALNDFMLNNDIDVVQFESAVKVGGQGITNINWSSSKVSEVTAQLNNGEYKGLNSQNYLNNKRKKNPDWEFETGEDIKKFLDTQLKKGVISSKQYNEEINDLLPSYKETIDILNDRALNADGTLKEEVVHEHQYNDYMIATATPEHFFDTEAIYPSQFRNLIIADINDNDTYTLHGKTLKGSEIKEHYRKLVTENLLDSFTEVKDIFGDVKKLQEKLKGMIAGNPRYGDDMNDALELIKDKEGNLVFNLPLHSPVIASRLQELLNSLWKTTVTKQKITGGAGILVTDFGFSNSLKVVRNDDGSIKEIECYMPAYSKKFYKKYLNSNGSLDYARMEKECPELLKAVGTRIPTEGKYSMLNLKIKGFLSPLNGGALMLPAEITRTAGSDFDIDKVFLQFFAFKTSRKYDRKRMMSDFYSLEDNKDIVEDIDKELIMRYMDYISQSNEDISFGKYMSTIFPKQGISKLSLSKKAQERFEIWFKNNKDKYITDITYNKIKYDDNLSYGENSLDARNNELIDIAYSILSNKAHAVHFSNPGSFDKIKRISRAIEIAENPEYSRKYMEVNDISNNEDLKKSLLSAKLDDLDDFLKKYRKDTMILSPQTFLYNHRQNMMGAKLIGMYANNNSMQAKFQNSGLRLKSNFNFVVNGRTIDRLDRQKTDPIGSDGVTELISKNCAEWLAASVDNVKDPVLTSLLQNPKTANITGFMLRGGMAIDEVALFFKHPTVSTLINSNEDGAINRKTVQEWIKSILNNYGKKISVDAVYSLDSSNILDLIMNNDTNKMLSLIDAVAKEDISDTVSKEDMDLIQEWYNMLNFLNNIILPIDKTMSDMVNCCRADSPNGAIARTLPMALNQKIRLDNFWSKSTRDMFPLEDLGVLPNPSILQDNGLTVDSSIDSIREALYSTNEGLMLQAFTTLGIIGPLEVMQKYFKPFQNSVLNRVTEVVRNHDNFFGTVKDDVMNNIFNDLTTFLLSKTEFFGDSEEATYKEKRDWYLYEFPKKFLEIVEARGGDYDTINSLEFMKKLRVIKGEIMLKHGGSLTSTTKELLKSSFDSLLYMDSEIAEQLATDLFAYAYYSKGFRFDSFDFSQFFSTTFLTTVGNKIMDDLRNYELSEEDLNNFVEQLYMNRLEDIAPYLNLKSVLEDEELTKKKVNNIAIPLSIVYNDHTDIILSNGIDIPPVFPKLSTNFGYYVLDTSRGNNGINTVESKVYYKRVYRFNPEQLGTSRNRKWFTYNASKSASDMASEYYEDKKARLERLEELRKLFSNSKNKRYSGKSKIKSSNSNVSPNTTLSEATGNNYRDNTMLDMNKEDRKGISNLTAKDVEIATRQDQDPYGINNISFGAVKAANEIDVSESTSSTDGRNYTYITSEMADAANQEESDYNEYNIGAVDAISKEQPDINSTLTLGGSVAAVDAVKQQESKEYSKKGEFEKKCIK